MDASGISPELQDITKTSEEPDREQVELENVLGFEHVRELDGIKKKTEGLQEEDYNEDYMGKYSRNGPAQTNTSLSQITP